MSEFNKEIQNILETWHKEYNSEFQDYFETDNLREVLKVI